MSDAWPAAETALLKHLVQKGWGPAEIWETFQKEGIDKSFQAVRGKIRREKRRHPAEWHVRIAANPECARRFDQQVKVEAGSALLTGDWHAPFHDARWGDRVIELGLRRKVEMVGIVGDLVDFDAFSKYGRQERVEAEDEIRSAEQIVTALATEFPQVVYSGGNHEMRLPRKTDNLLALRDAMGMFVRSPNVTITDYQWFEVLCGGREWYAEHPKNASVIGARVPAQLAAKFHKNVAGFHGHLWGITMDVSGTWYGVDVGICADRLRLAYITKVHSTRPQVCQGALLIEDGIPLLLNADNIDRY